MLVRDLVELFEPPAREERLQLIHQTPISVAMHGNRQLVAQLISNLIENAIKYVPAGGTIIVSAARVDGSARLVVADNGPGIPAQDRARAVEPFVRLESAEGASGSGLGLSLVAAITRLHGAQLTLEDNKPGLRVAVVFAPEKSPIQPAQPRAVGA
jgi:signal transduction histidine kinase